MLSEQIKEKIKKSLPDSTITVIDFSEEHEDHHAPGAHIALTVVDKTFEGKSLSEQHQVIYEILKEEIKNETIHALRIRTKTKENE
jgi:stress-induced morphogen|tara:strand:- start:274 stop:531 length:258 start_codon:yes stop_codon:yes gene_type:complete